jgi:CubicO group peptidase (beta-lactamase class C family)
MGKGLTAPGLQHLHKVAASYVDNTLVPGLVALIACGEQVHVETLGTLRLGGHPVTRDSIFRISSITKPITAAAALVLVGENLFNLDTAVDALLPELANRRVLARMNGPLEDTIAASRAITVRDLLTFTFGFGLTADMFASPTPWPIVEATDALHLATMGPPDPEVQPDPDSWIAGLGSLPLMAHPGQRWLYNTGAQVLGVLAARASGQRLADVLRTRIFDPLAMKNTGFWTPQAERLATAYQPTSEGLAEWDAPNGAWSHPPAFGDGAVGLVSTADDLLAFSRMLLNEGSPVMSPEFARSMTTDQLTPMHKIYEGLTPDFFTGRSWGFGLAVLDNGAYGWDGSLGTSWLVDPNHDLVVIVLTQRLFETSQTPAVHRDIQSAAYAALA